MHDATDDAPATAPGGGEARGGSADFTGLATWLARLAMWALGGLFVVASLVLAVTIPIHATDALTYGEWSRSIGETGDLHFDGVGPAHYHRPLFYVLQGWIWGIFGFHEWLGRVLALVFTVWMLGATAWLASRSRMRGGVAAFAIGLLCLVPDVRKATVSGLSDIPLAALVATTAAVAWSARLGRARPWLVAASAALAVLAKPTALVALVGLVGALAIGSTGWRKWVMAAAPVAAGAAIGLAWDVAHAIHLDLGLMEFLRAGSTGFYADLARSARADQLLGLQFVGPDLRPVVALAVAYGILRVAGLGHARARFLAPATGVLAAVTLPVLADATAIHEPFRTTGSTIGFLALAATGFGLVWCPVDRAPERAWLARLLVLAVVPYAVWNLFGAYDTRLGSAAWPGLIALCALCLAAAVEGLATRGPALVALPVAAILALAVFAYTDLDGLGKEQWSEFRRLGTGELFDERRARGIVLPQLQKVIDLTAPEMGSDGRMMSAEGSLRFYFPRRVEQSYARSCDDLDGLRAFVLLTDEGTQAYMRDVARVPWDPAYWAACRGLSQLSDGSGGYAVYRVERD